MGVVIKMGVVIVWLVIRVLVVFVEMWQLFFKPVNLTYSFLDA